MSQSESIWTLCVYVLFIPTEIINNRMHKKMSKDICLCFTLNDWINKMSIDNRLNITSMVTTYILQNV